MRTRATAKVEIKRWDETPYDEREGIKLARASVAAAYRGEVEGESATEFLMAYRTDGAASYVGLERIVGRVGGRSGSFVVQGTGTYRDGTAEADLLVVPGAGSGELAGLRGEGHFVAVGAEYPNATLTLDYWFE